MTRYLGLIFLGALTGMVVSAVELPVVKVASYPCDNLSRTKFGSGTLVERDDRIYVLTSDHVLFHGNASEGACHRIYSPRMSRPFAAVLRAVSIGKGLGLLELEGHDSLGLAPIPYARLQADAGKEISSFATICGFPHGSQRLFCDKNGQVLSGKSDRTILPFIREVIEVSGHNEYGMSGGIIVTADDAIAGVVSHQYLQLVVGGPAKLFESKEGMATGELVALGIPLSAVVPWLDAYFGGNPDDLRYELSQQLRGKSVLSLDGVRFQPKECAPALDHWSWRVPDPVGIGGDVAVEGNVCEVVLSLEKPGVPTQKWPFEERAWFKRVKEKLQAGGTAVLTGLFFQGKKYAIHSLINLVSKIEANVTPTIKISDPFTEPAEVVRDLLVVSAKVRVKAGYLRERFYKDLLTKGFLDQVLAIAEACEGKQFDLVDLEDLRRLLESKLWTEMMVEELDATVELKGALYKVRELLAKIQG